MDDESSAEAQVIHEAMLGDLQDQLSALKKFKRGVAEEIKKMQFEEALLVRKLEAMEANQPTEPSTEPVEEPSDEDNLDQDEIDAQMLEALLEEELGRRK